MISSARNRIVVIGSSNMDLVMRAPRLPLPGETLAGTGFRAIPGGKGANQAVAAARLGGQVSFVSCLGMDAFGDELAAGLSADGIDLIHVHRVPGVATGVASITVGEDGANSIVLAAGANAALTVSHIDAAEALIAEAALLVCQLEVPMDVVGHAVELAARHGTRVVFNPAPAEMLPDELMKRIDYLVLNESEASLLAAQPVVGLDSARRAADVLLRQGARHVLLTLGADGVWLAGPAESVHLPALRVNAVDTTAAGDTFIGGLAAALAAGETLRAAILLGQRAAAIGVTRFGAQTSIPYRAEVDAFEQ